MSKDSNPDDLCLLHEIVQDIPLVSLDLHWAMFLPSGGFGCKVQSNWTNLQLLLRRSQEGAIGVVDQVQGEARAWAPIADRIQRAQACYAALEHAPSALLVHIALAVTWQRCHHPHLMQSHRTF